MRKRKTTTSIVVHGAFTPPSMDIGVAEIRDWHMNRPEPFPDIGYHYVIRRSGLMELGRDLDLRGAHAYGVNSTSVGICLVGGMLDTSFDFVSYHNDDAWDFNYTQEQIHALTLLIENLRLEFPDIATVMGHRDVPGTKKLCPGFDVRLMFPLSPEVVP